MKLISMIDFVLQPNTNEKSSRRLSKIIGYAEFLKQPLKLEMFFCSIPEPELQGGYAKDGTFVGGYDEQWIKEYKEAKEKVLFEGFEVRGKEDYNWLFNDNLNKAFGWFDKDKFIFFSDYNTIEDLVNYNLTLTPNAIKQFNL